MQSVKPVMSVMTTWYMTKTTRQIIRIRGANFNI